MKRKYILLKNKVTGERSIYNTKTKERVQEKDDPVLYASLRKKTLNNLHRQQKDQCLRDVGLTKVKGNCGGVYWE